MSSLEGIQVSAVERIELGVFGLDRRLSWVRVAEILVDMLSKVCFALRMR